jgi:hypothetical protein
MHAQRWYRYEDVDFKTSQHEMSARNRTAQLKLKKAKPTSYLKYFGRHEHRVVAEKILGRALTRRDVVHHIDSDRHNNHPSNLNEHRKDLIRGRKIKRGY